MRVVCRLMPFLLMVVPPLLIARYLETFAVDVPYWDQWVFAPFLVKAAHGTMTFGDVIAFHNEHRLALPRLLMLGLAWMSGWNVRWEIWGNLAINVATLMLLAGMIRRATGAVAPGLTPWLIALASWLTFSPSQAENWTWGWTLQIFMNVFFVTATASVLGRWRGGWAGLLAICALAVASALSYGTGLMLVGLVPAAILFAPVPIPWPRRLAQVALAAVVCGAFGALYFVGFASPDNVPPPERSFADPWAFLLYVFAYVGASFGATDVAIAMRWGFVGVVAFVAGTVFVWRHEPGLRASIAPFVLLASFALLSGILTAIARAGYGVLQAVAGRYITISALFWVSLLPLIGVVLRRALDERHRGGPVGTAAVAITAALLTLAMQGYAASWHGGVGQLETRNAALRRGRRCVRHLDTTPPECLKELFLVDVRELALELQSVGLGPRRDVAPGRRRP